MIQTANGHSNPVEFALTYRAAGLSPVPVKADGSKAPTIDWKALQEQICSEDDIRLWFAGQVGVGIAHGKVSGNTECIDLDSAEIATEYRQALEAVAPGLLQKLCIISTPRPGFHLIYKCSQIDGNQKLARDEAGKVLIETRGEGGYALAPGSPAECHETGRPYEHAAGPDLTDLPHITVEERETLHAVARSFNRHFRTAPVEHPPRDRDGARLSPGDDYNSQASWQDILLSAGWTIAYRSGDITHWRRPGKSIGTSATTGCRSKAGNELLYVFSTNALPFESERTYDKFGAYAILQHGGDFSAAARQLAQAGYGEKQRPGMQDLRPPELRDLPEDHPTPQRTIDPYLPFPTHVLPASVRKYVEAGAKAIGCDASFIALPLLACLARAIGNTRTIRLKRSWCEPAIIWGALVGKSGTSKTPAMAAATVFLEKRQADSIREYEAAVRQHEQDEALYDRAYSDWRKSKSTTDPPPWKPTQPTCRRYMTSDATMEAISTLLNAQSDGLLVVRDELAGWLGGMGEYKAGKGGDLGHWLSMWSAAPMTVDRKSTKVPLLHIPRASVGVVGGVQPGILRQAIGREHRQNGLCQRLLLVMPDATITGWTDATIDVDAQARMQLVFDRLFELQPAADADGNPEPYPLDLTPEAKDVFVEYYNAHEVEMHAHEDDLAAAWSKLRAYTARFALIFQLCAWADGEGSESEIDQQSMLNAIELSRWFGHEAERVYGLFHEDREDEEMRELAEWIGRNGGRITPRKLQQRNSKYRTAGEAEPALNRLENAGYGHWEIVDTAGRQRRDFVLSTSVNVNGSP